MNVATLCLGCMENDSGEAVCSMCGIPLNLQPAHAHQLPPRTVLHNLYIVGRVLGDGGFGITYLAWDTAAQTRVAIKEYLPKGVATRASGNPAVLPYDATRRAFEMGPGAFSR